MPLPEKLSTGLMALDASIGGIPPGSLVLLQGPTGSGRTTFLEHFAHAALGKGVLPSEIFLSDPEQSERWRGLLPSENHTNSGVATGAFNSAQLALSRGVKLVLFDSVHLLENPGYRTPALRIVLGNIYDGIRYHNAIGVLTFQTRRARRTGPAVPEVEAPVGPNSIASHTLTIDRNREGEYTVIVRKNNEGPEGGIGKFRLVQDPLGVPRIVETVAPLPKEKIPTVWDRLMDRAP